MTENGRYKNKPFLRLLECYVLFAIDELSSFDQLGLTQMEPKLQELYQIQGEWFDIIEAVMELPPNTAEQILVLWERNIEIAEINGRTLIPQEFAEMIVDQNLT